ncbi:hypothetical protein [Opitutus sp. ER46]|uniref:hypothetical protein n=1 Tax=Opitutus sp. ER46 TaxID=2161864 RepID=UPI000D303E29|nr:hypothetical protein [Opitutus sp. ER46]PTX92571.1 hypothetical protein DB354_14680 [Opitutus sp. ER46]
MSRLQFFALKLVRWTGWLLIPVVLAFFFTGYALSDGFGLGVWLDERTALALHRRLHLPLALLVGFHLVPSVYLAFVRWEWIKPRA